MSHLIVAHLLDAFDIKMVLLKRAKGASVDEIAKQLNYPRVEVARLLRVINDLTRGPTP